MATLRGSIAYANVASQLDYFREGSAAHCPDEPKLRQAVAARLGYDPFIDWSPRRVVAEISANGTRLVAIIRLVDGGGIVQSRSEIAAEPGECKELVDAVALAIAIHLDPDAAMRVDHAEQTQKEELDAAASADEPKPRAVDGADVPMSSVDLRSGIVRVDPAPARVALRLGAAYLGGLEAHETLAAKAGASLRVGLFQAVGEISAGVPQTTSYRSGGVRSYALSATLLPCARYGWFAGCAEVMLDRVVARGVDVPVPAQVTWLQVAVGARIEATWDFSPTWSVLAGLDLLRNLSATSMRLERSEVWHSPSYRYAIGLATEMRFP